MSFLSRLRRRWRLLLLSGSDVACPCCGGSFRRFMVDERRRVLVCPRCGSHERHRALWLYLAERVAGDELEVLHWAPEPAIERRLRELPNLRYTSADIEPGKAMAALDITTVDAPDGSFDLILCSHVLEHIPDDRRAMRELARLLRRPKGRALVLVPVDRAREETYEDPAIATPAERRRAYWADDHVRLYGRDFRRRLEGAGLEVAVERPAADLDAATLVRFGLDRDEEIYVCKAPD